MAEKIELYEHPEYKAQEADWKLFQALYDGKHGELTQEDYLWPTELELKPGNNLRKIKQQRSRYTNFFEPVESTWVNICLSDKIDIPEDVKAIFKDYFEDVDGEGHNIETFIREKLAPHYFRFGRVFGLTDSPNGTAKTEAERQEKGIRPFWTVLNPLDVKDWQVFGEGKNLKKLETIRTEYLVNKRRSNLHQKPVQEIESRIRSLVGGVYRTEILSSPKDGVKTWTRAGQVEAQNWQELPIAYCMTEPWLNNVAQLCLSIFNLEASLDSGLNAQSIQRTYIAGDNDDKVKMKISEYGVIFLSAGSTVSTVEPFDSSPLSNRIDQKLRQLQRTAFNRAHALPDDSRESPSVDSQRKAQEETVALAKAAISDLENVVNQMVQHWAAFMNIPNFKGRIKLGRDIQLESVQEKIQIFQAYVNDIRKVPTWYKGHLKRIAERDNLADMPKVIAEIDALKIGEPENQQVETRGRILGGLRNDGQRETVVSNQA